MQPTGAGLRPAPRGCRLSESLAARARARQRPAAAVRASHGVPLKDADTKAAATAPLREALREALRRAGHAALGAAAAAAVLLPAGAAPPGGYAPAEGAPPAEAPALTFPASPDPRIFAVQKTLVEAWAVATRAYVDPSAFGRVGWLAELEARVAAAAAAPSPEAAQAEISGMLARLGDPYTRWLPAGEYRKFRVSSDGEVQGVGLLLAAEPGSGRLLVLAPLEGSPAARAGIRAGDEVVAVDGQATAGWDSERASTRLRGRHGTEVSIEVARPAGGEPAAAAAAAPGAPPGADQIPGLARRGGGGAAAAVERHRYRVRRDRVDLTPVFATTLRSAEGRVFGYVRLVTFSARAADDVRAALYTLRRDGAEAFVLDLRNNPGGLVSASLDVASQFLDARRAPTAFAVQDRGGGAALTRVALSGAAPPAAAGAPLAVLVNGRSASAAEILAGALRDNGGAAAVLGDSPTFGKGKIQSVYELADGSALLVTVAKYRTPAGTEIDGVGVRPDRACGPAPAGGGGQTALGVPIGPGASEAALAELETDACVLAAERVLAAGPLAAAPSLRG